ncbi:MAG: hypothetical protein P8X96_14090 [Desulfobacteraceae bacterium]
MASSNSLRNRLKRVNRWGIFEPARWPHRELVSRLAALLIIMGFLALRIHQFDRFPQTFDDARRFYAGFRTVDGQLLYTYGQIAALWGIRLAVWIIETAIYLGYIASYAGRARARSIAAGFMETAFPLIVAGMPVLLSFMPYNLPRWAPFSSPAHLYFYLGIMGHPLYTGHFIMFFGSLLLRLHPVSVMLYLSFCVGQVLRARIEERKLMQAFPEYALYQKRTGMFVPRIRK